MPAKARVPGSRWNRCAPWLVPILLGSVALTQLTRAHFSFLSPWKGGGFGMFSTVDSPGARFLRIHLVTPEGEIPILLPPELRDEATKLRTLGTKRLAADLAATVSQGTWIRLRLASAVEYYRRLLERSGPDNRSGELAAELRSVDRSRRSGRELTELNFVRMLGKGEALGIGDAVVAVRGVRVELWRYSFDATAEALSGRKDFEIRWDVGTRAETPWDGGP